MVTIQYINKYVQRFIVYGDQLRIIRNFPTNLTANHGTTATLIYVDVS